MTTPGPAPAAVDRARWQFNLRSILLVTLIAAAFSAIYRVAPQLDVLVAGVAPAIWSVLRLARHRRRGLKLSRLALCGAVAAWSLAYLVGVGPAIVVVNRFAWTLPIFETLYGPVNWVYENTPADVPLGWYAEFWRQFG